MLRHRVGQLIARLGTVGLLSLPFAAQGCHVRSGDALGDLALVPDGVTPVAIGAIDAPDPVPPDLSAEVDRSDDLNPLAATVKSVDVRADDGPGELAYLPAPGAPARPSRSPGHGRAPPSHRVFL